MSNIDIDIEIDEEENEQLRSIPAQRLIEKLSLLKNRVDSAKKRWFWELLQNASDYNESVNVKLVVSDGEVMFRHDGAPFSLRDVLNLISPDSNKKDDELHEDNIGKFGTGLVSTHILSSILEIKGLCIGKKEECHEFFLTLDRSCFTDKKSLIRQIIQAKENLKESLQKHDNQKGFNTLFLYKLGNPLPGLPSIKSSDIDLDYLYETLPYTLCFMPKVQSVKIDDFRSNATIGSFYIKRDDCCEHQIKFSIKADSKCSNQNYAYFSVGDVSTVFRYENDEVQPIPSNLSRIFCGLPLVGTEEVGLPILLNSLNFEPTTEREGVELEPNSNEVNRNLFKDSVVLYGNVLDYVVSNKMKNAYHLARLRNRYNGTQISRHQFNVLYLKEYKQRVLNHNIVLNEDGQFISFSSVLLPFKESKSDIELYKNCKLLNRSLLPAEKDYQAWFDTTDFTIFTDQKYTYERLAEQIEAKDNIYSFGKSQDEILSWLYQCVEFFKSCDGFIFSKKKLLPNQSGNLCLDDNNLFTDENLPVELKDVYDALYAKKNKKIGDKLLNEKFSNLNILKREFSIEMLAAEIDSELSVQYSDNQGNTSAISSSLNKLYNWINSTSISKEKLSAYFHWYYPKRATLIVDMLSENQREQALVIAQSGKMESLATLASSEITDEELRFLVANIKKIPTALFFLTAEVDDKEFADSVEGDMGENFVYKDLLSKYPRAKGYSVIWASKERKEPCYDFEVKKNEQVFFYCDAKTTKRGIANSDSIPFFMRKSQWVFLNELDDSIPYYIARVFVADNNQIKYIRISSSDL